jgi:chorismate dehydratase
LNDENKVSRVPDPDQRLRIAAINFLNPAPLMWDFERPPLRDELSTRYVIEEMAPSACAEKLASRVADIGLVPIAAYATIPDLSIIPGCTVASKGTIRSLLLIYREASGIESIRTVAADISSRATFAYVQILFKKYWKVPVSFAPHAPNLDAMLAACDAAIVIGDPALLALEDKEAREQRTGEKLTYLDLGKVWREATGHAWVSAFWAVRNEAMDSEKLREQVRNDFITSRDHGLLHRDELAHAWASKLTLPLPVVQEYLTTNIHYVLDDECLAAIKHFFVLAEECGVLPAAPAIRLL